MCFNSLPCAHLACLILLHLFSRPVAAVWGMLISAIGVLCIAASMAEICKGRPASIVSPLTLTSSHSPIQALFFRLLVDLIILPID